jgi:3-hydroxyisobutyrate dehydrogenase-like beta-hydroxyacid dehydrogenase
MEQQIDLAFVGFGEAAQAFCEGWDGSPPARLRAYDRKTSTPADAEAKRKDYARFGIDGQETNVSAVTGADAIISVVTADQALTAAQETARGLAEGALYLDMNSVAPETKRAAAEVITAAGGRYVDVAVMAPVYPALLGVPLLLGGPDARSGQALLSALGFRARVVGEAVGVASAIKMVRSIMIKGLEALTAECVLSAYAAGVQDEVLASLDASFPGFDWRTRADYNLDRMIVHGRRRAEEMKESAAAARHLGQTGAMAGATAAWQARIGDLCLQPPEGLDAKVDAILRATGARS